MRYILFCFTCLVIFSRCKNSVDKLPDLTAAQADSVIEVKGHKIWATSINLINDEHPAVETIAVPMIACADKNKYRVWVYYTITICTYPSDVLSSETASLFNGNDSIVRLINSRDQMNSFRLSKSDRLRTETSLWCKRLSGPWVAEVSETQQCNNPDAYRTIVVLTGVPNPIKWEWWGTFNDKAAQMGLQPTGQLFGFDPERIKCSDRTECN